MFPLVLGPGTVPKGDQGIEHGNAGGEIDDVSQVVHILQRRRGGKALEGMDQAVVPVDVDVQAGDDVVKGQFSGSEVVILPGNLVQGVRHVESIVLFLGIQHQRKLIAALHHLDQAGMLAGVPAAEAFIAGLGVLPGGTKFIAEDRQGMGQILFTEDGEGRNQGQEGDGQGKYLLLSHTLNLKRRPGPS